MHKYLLCEKRFAWVTPVFFWEDLRIDCFWHAMLTLLSSCRYILVHTSYIAKMGTYFLKTFRGNVGKNKTKHSSVVWNPNQTKDGTFEHPNMLNNVQNLVSFMLYGRVKVQVLKTLKVKCLFVRIGCPFLRKTKASFSFFSLAPSFKFSWRANLIVRHKRGPLAEEKKTQKEGANTLFMERGEKKEEEHPR